MATFLETVTRIASELRRSNLTTEIKNAINDAIYEGANTRFYFNEMRGVTFNTVIGTEYYTDGGLVEIDAAWYIQNGTRYNLAPESKLYADATADGNQITGQLQTYSRNVELIRLFPVPATVVAVYFDGFGKLSPTPLAADADTNAWLTVGERYIRALAKSILLRDVIKDFGQATVYEAIAEDRKSELLEATTLRISTGVLKSTSF